MFSVIRTLCVYFAVDISISRCHGGDMPVIAPFLFPATLKSGDSASVMCSVQSGKKPITFEWKKNGEDIIKSPVIEVQTIKDKSWISIESVTSINSGNYTCIVTNSFGSDQYTASLTVSAPPIWKVEPNNIVVQEGKTVEVECQATGIPIPKVEWRRKDIVIPSKDGSNVDISASGSLFINNIDVTQKGEYTCLVRNGYGNDLQKTIVIEVRVPARFDEKFKVQSVRQGDSAVLRCDVTGDQPINIVWFKDKHELEITELSRYEKFETFSKNGVNSELFIRNVDRRDGALYSCTATNSYGSDERNIKVLVVEVPAQPLDVKVLDIWARSVGIRWSAPYAGNSAITKYKIQYWRDKHGPQTLNEVEATATQTTADVQDLKPGTSYALAVVAENEIGHGEPSETIRFTTGEEEPSGPPTDLYVEARGPTSILVKWKPPPKECWNGVLKGYYVGYKVEGINQPYTFKSIEASSNGSDDYLITGLSKSARYSVLVKAYNKAGTGPPSQELVLRTLDGDLPKSPPISIMSSSDTAIAVQWNQVLPRDEPLTGYTLHYQRGTGQWLHVPLVSPDQSSYTLTGLQADTVYHMYLTATNKHGRGQASEVLVIRTKELGARDMPFYLDLSLVIPAAAALVALVVVIVVIIIYVTKSRSREDLVKDQIKALHGQQQYIYAAAGAVRCGDLDKGRPYSQGEPGTPAMMSIGSYASIPSRIDQDELYGGPSEVKGPYGQTYKERPSSFPRPSSRRARDAAKAQQQQQLQQAQQQQQQQQQSAQQQQPPATAAAAPSIAQQPIPPPPPPPPPPPLPH